MTTTVIRGGRVIDPSQGLDRVADVAIRNGFISEIGAFTGNADRTIDATGQIVCPGFVDLHVSLREPGFEEDETTESGTAAALAGGFTSIASMPDTEPVVDNRASAEFVTLQADRAGHCHVFPLGSTTKEHAGEELAEIGQLVQGNAVAFTDGHVPISNSEIMRRALEYTRMFDRPIFNLPLVPELAAGGVMHEGFFSTKLGLRGIPAAAQDIMVGRDIALAEMTGGRVHLMCLTTRGSVERVRDARARGVRVSADVTPHHLALTDEALTSFDANCRVHPPLTSAAHVEALIEGLKDGTISAISSDHQPLSEEKKACEIDLAPPGISGLETVLPVCVKALIEPGHIDWPRLIEVLTSGPAAILGIDKGTLKSGAAADITVLSPDEPWTIRPEEFRSRSRNTPFADWSVRGRVKTVLVDGDVRYPEPAPRP